MVTAQRWQLFKVGRTLGTAKLAKVVGVKFSTSGAGPKPENTIRAWRWAINDVNTKGRDGKAVFLHPFVWPMPAYEIPNQRHEPSYYRDPYNIPAPASADSWIPLLVEAMRAGIPVVSSTGNAEQYHDVNTQGDIAPQRYAKPNNPLINVAGINADGTPFEDNLPIGPNHALYALDPDLQGEITIYALAENILVANAKADAPGFYRIADGTSASAPMIAGLIGYYLTLPTTVAPPLQQLPMVVKRHLVSLARNYDLDGPGTAYNGVWDLPCGGIQKRGKLDNGTEEVDEVL